MSVNPDEVVAMSAAVQGGVLAGDVEEASCCWTSRLWRPWAWRPWAAS